MTFASWCLCRTRMRKRRTRRARARTRARRNNSRIAWMDRRGGGRCGRWGQERVVARRLQGAGDRALNLQSLCKNLGGNLVVQGCIGGRAGRERDETIPRGRRWGNRDCFSRAAAVETASAGLRREGPRPYTLETESVKTDAQQCSQYQERVVARRRTKGILCGQA